MSDIIYKIAFSSLKGITIQTAKTLLEKVGSEKEFFTLREAELKNLTSTSSPLFADDVRRKVVEDAQKEYEFINRNNISTVYFNDEIFSERLLQCEDAPLMLYGVGECDLNSAHILSIVGTRNATSYGIGFTQKLVEDLANKIDNLVIISGLAYGIDIAAHRAALKAGVPTIAIVANGLSTVYPTVHRNDAAEIVRRGGMILTEYYHDDPIHRSKFLARNRIVAGMADGIVVVESARKGGAMRTAQLSTDYGREVMALPGRISDIYSRGCNHLIANSTAALIESADDLIAAMKWTPILTSGTQAEIKFDFTPDEQKIIDYLRFHGDTPRNKLSIEINIPISRLSSILTDLEFVEAVECIPGGKIRLK